MAAIDVMPSSPMTPGQSAPWNSFEDYLDFPSPLHTPRLAPLAAPSSSQQAATAVLGPSQSLAPIATTSTQQQTQQIAPPPPPGSSPEVLFRYYLAAELRRIGSSADDNIIDRYVAQHYDSFTKAMGRQQNQLSEDNRNVAPSAATGDSRGLMNTSELSAMEEQGSSSSGVNAFRSPPPTGPSSAPYLLSNEGFDGQSINPHLMELSSVHQPFTVSRLPPSTESTPIQASSAMSITDKGKFRESSADNMSEDDDDEEDSKDGLTDLVKNLKSSPASSSRSGHRGQEETIIAGSIMGPSNELRPDPEAYRKLSSKEKRQLRNKISARNFRTRRKEHIAHLEEQVADRDTIIEGLRQQLALIKVQNKDLTEEVRVLKSKAISNADVSRIIEALQKGASASGSAATGEMGPPSHLLRSSSNSSLSETVAGRPSTPASPRSNSPRPLLARPNMRKDLPASSSAAASKSFWGGVGGTGNNFMSVHTVLVPNLMDRRALGSQKLLAIAHAPAQNQEKEVLTLSRLVEHKLGLGDDKADMKETLNKSAMGSSMGEADVNEAIVSLLGDAEPAPPCYSDAIASPPVAPAAPSTYSSSTLNLEDERVHAAMLAALKKAFSSPAAWSNEKGATTSPGMHLDANKIQALLDGRATLVLYDQQKGQVWSEDAVTDTLHTSPAPAINSSIIA